MTHSEKLMQIEICAAWYVRVFWTDVKKDILSTKKIKQFPFKI